MADYDDAERHALQEVEPEGQLHWLLEEVDEDLAFFGWLQTQVAPPPGVPQLRCDCVAGLLQALLNVQSACFVFFGMAALGGFWRVEFELRPVSSSNH